MPVGKTNNPCECDDCGVEMSPGTDAYLDMDRLKVYCLDCRTEDGDPLLNPKLIPPPDPTEPKTVVVRHESSKVGDLKKENALLKKKLKEMTEAYEKLRNHARELLKLSQNIRKGKKPDQPLSLTEERLRLRGK